MCQNSQYKKIFKDAQFTVEQEFKNHKIGLIWSRYRYSWFYVHNPKSRLYSFTLGFFNDGTITFTGDIGDYILKVSDADSLNWLISTMNSERIPIDYITSKIVAGKKFDWYEEDLKEYLKQNKELSEDDPDKLPNEIVDYYYTDYSKEEFIEAMYNWNAEACDMFERPSFGAILMICAMKWFVENLSGQDEDVDLEVIVE